MINQITILKNFQQFLNENYKIIKDIPTIIKLLKSKKAFEILDNSNAPGTTFQFGGCWILAEALSSYYNLPIYVIYNKQKNIIEHFITKLNTMFLDSDGIQSNTQIIKKIAEDGNYNISDLYLIKYNEKLNNTYITKDTEASKKLIELFNK
jgi:hypothetical protein